MTSCKPCSPSCASTAWPPRSTAKSNAPSVRPYLPPNCSIGCSARRPRRDANAASLTASIRRICRGGGRWSSFPFERQPGVNKTQINSLAGLDFLRRADNLLLIGPPGTGKTGIALGLLREACLNGYRGRFYNAQALFDELYASLADRSTARLLKRLSRLQVLLIDELGYLTLKPEQANAFFRLMDQRYSRASTIITTNLDLPDWYGCSRKNPLSTRCLTACSITASPFASTARRCEAQSPNPPPQGCQAARLAERAARNDVLKRATARPPRLNRVCNRGAKS